MRTYLNTSIKSLSWIDIEKQDLGLTLKLLRVTFLVANVI